MSNITKLHADNEPLYNIQCSIIDLINERADEFGFTMLEVTSVLNFVTFLVYTQHYYEE